MLDIDKEIKKLVDEHSDLWKKKSYKKGEILLKSDVVPTHNYFIETGILKVYTVDEERMETINHAFLCGGNPILSLNWTNINIRTIYNIEVIKNANIYSINANNWNKITQEKPLINEIVSHDVNRMFEVLIKQRIINSKPDTTTRYKLTLKMYPFLTQINDDDVGSLLGVSARSVRTAKVNQKNN